MGLLTGFSIISGVEIIYFAFVGLIRMLIGLIWKKNNKNVIHVKEEEIDGGI